MKQQRQQKGGIYDNDDNENVWRKEFFKTLNVYGIGEEYKIKNVIQKVETKEEHAFVFLKVF